MRAVIAIVAAAAIWVVCTVVVAVGVESIAPVDQLTDDWARVAWFAVPQAFVTLAMVLGAALVYGRERLRTFAAAAAVFTLPAVDLTVDVVLSLGSDTPFTVLAARVACYLLGAGAAWWAVLPKKERNVFAPR